MQEKPLILKALIEGKDEYHKIDIPGIHILERLTPKMAVQAAQIVFGHRDGVTVTDGARAYRIYSHSHRRLGPAIATIICEEYDQQLAISELAEKKDCNETAQEFMARLEAE